LLKFIQLLLLKNIHRRAGLFWIVFQFVISSQKLLFLCWTLGSFIGRQVLWVLILLFLTVLLFSWLISVIESVQCFKLGRVNIWFEEIRTVSRDWCYVRLSSFIVCCFHWVEQILLFSSIGCWFLLETYVFRWSIRISLRWFKELSSHYWEVILH